MAVHGFRGVLLVILAALSVAGHTPLPAKAAVVSDGAIQATAPLLSDRGLPAVPTLRIAAASFAPAAHPASGESAVARAGALASAASPEAVIVPPAADRRLPPFFSRVSYRTTGPPLRTT
jgi:hypothetical protein